MAITGQAATKQFATRIAHATKTDSAGDKSRRELGGKVINETESKRALESLKNQPASVNAPVVRDVLEQITRGELVVTDAAREGFIDAYLKAADAPPPMRMSPLNARIGQMVGAKSSEPSLKPSVVIPEKSGMGGSTTLAAKVFLDNRVSFVKANAGSDRMQTLRANFESDIIGGKIFDMLGVRAPQSRVVDISANPELAASMGTHVLDMDFVDEKLAGGKMVASPFDAFGIEPMQKDAHPVQYHQMFVVDLLIGNSDRRDANFFNVEKDGKISPVPVDNNCGLLSGLTNGGLTNHTNFLKTFGDPKTAVSYDGVEPGSLGGVRNIIYEAPQYAQILRDPKQQKTLLAEVDAMVSTLTDEKINALVDGLPREIIPDGASVTPWRTSYKAELAAGTLPPAWQDVMDIAWGANKAPLSGDELFAARKAEIKDTLTWRRDNLRSALEAVIANGVDDL